jgi:hypothetical protein
MRKKEKTAKIKREMVAISVAFSEERSQSFDISLREMASKGEVIGKRRLLTESVVEVRKEGIRVREMK